MSYFNLLPYQTLQNKKKKIYFEIHRNKNEKFLIKFIKV